MSINTWIEMLPKLLGYVLFIIFLIIVAKWLIQLVQQVSDEDYEEVRYVNDKKNR